MPRAPILSMIYVTSRTATPRSNFRFLVKPRFDFASQGVSVSEMADLRSAIPIWTPAFAGEG